MEADGFGTSVKLFLYWESEQKVSKLMCSVGAA